MHPVRGRGQRHRDPRQSLDAAGDTDPVLEVAVEGELTNERVHLSQRQRHRWTSLEVGADERRDVLLVLDATTSGRLSWRFVLAQPAITAAVIGIRTPEQLAGALAVAAFRRRDL